MGVDMKKLLLTIGLLVVLTTVLLGIGVNIIKNTYSLEREEQQTVEVIKETVWQEKGDESSAVINVALENEEIEVPEKPKYPTLTLTAAGDCTLGYYPGQSQWNRFDQVAQEKGYDYFFENVREIFESDDLTLVNLEGPLTTATVFTEKEFVFKGEPDYVHILKNAGIEAVNLANNHTRDYGEIGYRETQKILKESGIGFFGEQDIFYHKVNGIEVGVIGFKGWTSDNWVKEQLRGLITQAKERSDLIIVMFHWGEEGVYYPVKAQEELARFVIDEGVHLVLGSHPHVIQGIEVYKGVQIVYSMGNFCFGGNRNPSDKDAFIYQQTFELQEKGIVAVNHQVIPCSISSVTEKNDYRPTPLVGEAKRLFEERFEKYSQFE
ncbi:MAG: Capsule synthesis protein CapA [Clostridia bacterium]|jgi:poly-gamma-glutamate synthesis protein (capsule biosynthesis protein)|nr:Capsule synthesis protein CapA [Clostridia bacterium]